MTLTHSVIVVDDHEVVRKGLRTLLRNEPAFRVITEAADGVEAVRSVEQHKPDVLLLDLSLPALGGLEVMRQALRVSPHTRVLVLSMHASESYIAQALRNGAAGDVRKDAPSEDVLDALREVVAGRRYLPQNVSPALIDSYLANVESSGFDALETLSARERQILQLTAEGHSATEIGERLFISPRTVETHRANVMRKLHLRTHSDLVLFAVRNQIIAL
ncbi:MAG: response regulator [Thermoanaerobaculia bacterium]